MTIKNFLKHPLQIAITTIIISISLTALVTTYIINRQQEQFFKNSELYKIKQDAFKKVLDVVDRHVPYRIENDEMLNKSINSKKWGNKSLFYQKSKKPSIDEIREAYTTLSLYSKYTETISAFINCISIGPRKKGSGDRNPGTPLVPVEKALKELKRQIRKELDIKYINIKNQEASIEENPLEIDGYIISEFSFESKINPAGQDLFDAGRPIGHEFDELVLKENIKNKDTTKEDRKIYNNITKNGYYKK